MTIPLSRRAAADAAIRDRSTLHAAFLTRATADTESREVSGIGVPYGETIEHYFGSETFDPGSVDSTGARLLFEHRTTIGLVTAGADTAAGHHITARISRIALGDDALTLVRDDVIRGFSIGFEPHEYRVEITDDGDEVIHWTKVRAREFSLVTFPAYESAQITNSRTAGAPRKDFPMPDSIVGGPADAAAAALTRADLTPINNSIEDLGRELRSLREDGLQTRDTDAGARWGSMGEFVRSLASGDADAAEFYTREFAGGTTDDTEAVDAAGGAGFLGNFIRFVQERRRVINLFDTGTLPRNGMSVSYAKLISHDLEVAEQLKQGDNLAGPGRLLFDDATEKVRTAGGWTQLSRQVIERSDVPYLDTVWTGLGLEYAKWTENYIRARLSSEVAALIAAGGDNVIAMPDATPDMFDWFDAIVDAGDLYEDRGFSMNGLLVSPDRFKQMMRLEAADGRPLMDVTGSGVNVIGSIDLRNRDANMGRVPVTILRKTTGQAFFYDPVAIKTLEASGSPFRLQDDNIINLTRAFSLYGYVSVIAPFPAALVPVTIPA